jgi:hypothetical protein
MEINFEFDSEYLSRFSLGMGQPNTTASLPTLGNSISINLHPHKITVNVKKFACQRSFRFALKYNRISKPNNFLIACALKLLYKCLRK